MIIRTLVIRFYGLRTRNYQTWVSSALMAEGLAIREALSHAQHLGITKIWICSLSFAHQSNKLGYQAGESLRNSLGHRVSIYYRLSIFVVFLLFFETVMSRPITYKSLPLQCFLLLNLKPY